MDAVVVGHAVAGPRTVHSFAAATLQVHCVLQVYRLLQGQWKIYLYPESRVQIRKQNGPKKGRRKI